MASRAPSDDATSQVHRHPWQLRLRVTKREEVRRPGVEGHKEALAGDLVTGAIETFPVQPVGQLPGASRDVVPRQAHARLRRGIGEVDDHEVA